MSYRNFSVYRLDGGVFLDLRLGGNVPPVQDVPLGCALLEGEFDFLSKRVELRPDDFGNAVVPVVVDYQPPKPTDDEWKTWAWNAETKRWISAPTTAALALSVRAERARRKAAADWVTLRAVRTGQPVPPDWAAYLQALADVPAQPGFPAAVIWPEPPAAP